MRFLSLTLLTLSLLPLEPVSAKDWVCELSGDDWLGEPSFRLTLGATSVSGQFQFRFERFDTTDFSSPAVQSFTHSKEVSCVFDPVHEKFIFCFNRQTSNHPGFKAQSFLTETTMMKGYNSPQLMKTTELTILLISTELQSALKSESSHWQMSFPVNTNNSTPGITFCGWR